MIQQGQVFKLKTKGIDGQPLWAYRYRLEGRSSERPQVGGFATRAEAEKALRKVLDRLGPGGGRATITLAEFGAEYLEMHQAAPVTITKLRWVLGKATAEFGEKRLADLTPRDVLQVAEPGPQCRDSRLFASACVRCAPKVLHAGRHPRSPRLPVRSAARHLRPSQRPARPRSPAVLRRAYLSLGARSVRQLRCR